MACIINAESGTGLTNSADGSGLLKVQSAGKTTNALAWVNFNGTGTVAIRSSYNVSSITDNGTGDYTVNFATALSDANYSAVFGLNQTATGNANNSVQIYGNSDANILTTSLRINSGAPSTGALFDRSVITVAIFGN